MEVRPIEHGDISQRPAFVDQSLDALDDEQRLLTRVERLHQKRLFVIGA